MTKQIKEMVYKPKKELELLAEGEHNGYEYFVLSFGTHPCAYIKLHDDDSADKAENLDVHGGVTYNRDYLRLNDERIEGKIIGWDYAHWNDYMGWDAYMGNDYSLYAGCQGHIHTTKEMIEDCIDAIDKWIDYKEKQND